MPSPSTLLVTSLVALSGVSSYVLPQSFQSADAASADPFHKASPRLFNSSSDATSSKRSSGTSFKVPLKRYSGKGSNAKRDLTGDELMAWAQRQGDLIRHKYSKGEAKRQFLEEQQSRKRQTIGLTDVGADSFYFAQVSVGTPAQNFDIILDTGSADFWVVDSQCTNSQCTSVATFNSAASSTFTGSNTPFQIQYGSGAVQGTLAADTVSLAGYVIDDLTFAEVDQLAANTLQPPTSGIMGMGFQTLSTSGATPFWEVLAEKGQLQTNAFTFQLARNNDNVQSASELNPGGVFTLGEIDSNQYSGDITYADVTGLGYWSVNLDSVSVNGASSTQNTLAAIDTGTTLIGGPIDAVESIYSQIPNAQPAQGSSQTEAYYVYPCSTNVQVSFTFGGKEWTMNAQDFSAGAVSRDYCLGSIFATSLGTESGVPQWIVGDAFLKNVFSVFRYSPASVGFASLKGSSAQTASTTKGAVGATATSVASSASSASGINSNQIPDFGTTTRTTHASTGIVAGSGLPTPSVANASPTSNTQVQSGGSGGSSGAVSYTAGSSALLSSLAVVAAAAWIAL